jgi:hypothetical protein
MLSLMSLFFPMPLQVSRLIFLPYVKPSLFQLLNRLLMTICINMTCPICLLIHHPVSFYLYRFPVSRLTCTYMVSPTCMVARCPRSITPRCNQRPRSIPRWPRLARPDRPTHSALAIVRLMGRPLKLYQIPPPQHRRLLSRLPRPLPAMV